MLRFFLIMFFLISKKLILWKLFLSFLGIILIFFINLKPAYSFSTIDACMAKPSCAAAGITGSGVRNNIIQTGTVAANKIVKFSRNGSSTSQTLNFAGKSIFSKAVDLFGIAFFTQKSIESLRDKATEKYCDKYPNECRVPATFSLRLIGEPDYNKYIRNVVNEIPVFTVEYEPAHNFNPDDYWYVNIYSPDGNLYDHRLVEKKYSNFALIYDFGGNPPDVEWDSLTKEQRKQAVSLLNDFEIIQEITNKTYDPYTVAPAANPENPNEPILIEPPPSIETDGDIVFFPPPITIFDGKSSSGEGNKKTTKKNLDGSQKTTTTTQGKSSSGNTVTTKTTVLTNSNGEIIDMEEEITVEPPDNNENENNDDNENFAPFPIPLESDSEFECVDCPNSIFKSEDSNLTFFVYALVNLSDKFPFDVIGNMPSSSNSVQECPQISFAGDSLELCEISDFFAYFKYPVWISFLIRLVTH